MQRPKGRIDPALFRRIVDSAEGWVHHLQLANFGEPLLHPDLPEMIHYAASRGFFVEVFTNGLLLDDERAEMLVRAGTGKVNVSIDALEPEVFKNIRGVEIQPILENLKRLSQARSRLGSRTPFIVIAAADLLANPGEPGSIGKRCAELGADAWYVTPSMNWAGSATDSDSVKPSGAEYSGCLFPWYLMNVSLDGIVTPCCIDAELRNEIGRIDRTDLRAIWNDEPVRRLRRALLARDLDAMADISNCHQCSRIYYSQNAYTLNRGRIELAQLRHFLGLK